MEEWRDIKGYEGFYQVSNEGRVKSLDRTIVGNDGVCRFSKGRYLKPRILKGGHFRIALCMDGTHKDKLVHVLVAEAFIPNPNNYNMVHHKDHNPTNNCVENLVWMSYQEHIEEHKAKIVHQYSLNGELVNEWEAVKDVIENGFTPSCVATCCRGEIKTYKGYIWKYA